MNKEETGNYEWSTTVYNINKGYNQDLLDNCHILYEYMYFVNCVKDNKRNGESNEKAIDHAIDTCIDNDILVDILKKQKGTPKVCVSRSRQWY